MSEVCTIGRVAFNTSLYLSAIQRLTVSPGLRVSRLSGDGQLSPSKAIVNQIAPALEFETLDLATALGLNSSAFAVAGLPLSAAFSGYMTQRNDDASLKSTGDKLSIAAGLIYPKRLSVRDMEPGVLTCGVAGRSSDGTTNPFSITADQTVPSTVVVPGVHTVGKVSINGSAAALVQSMELDFGIELIVLGGDGQLYPTKLFIAKVAPRFVIESADADLVATLTAGGTKQGATDSLVYLRKFDSNGGRVGDATQEHISFSIDDGIIYVEDVTCDSAGHDVVRFAIEPVWDATNNIVVVNAASAIS